MTEPLTQSIQDYLKHIYELTERSQPASTTDLAARLNVAPASVTGMLQKLAAAKPPLVIYKKHQGVTLTKAGLRAALEVIRHHRLLETYLVNALGYTWDEVHEEACRLEHVISEEFEARIATALGHPNRDPHGELIPSADLTMPADQSTPLSSLRPGQSATILRVDAQDPNLLRHLDDLGLTPGIEIEVSAYSEFDHNLTVRVRRKSHVLGLNTTTKIFVEVDK
ncbi:MAG: metal-dependent transcriptional regulator [Anaerolineaceae bacterium]|nr:MAG: metal-dependent transcriptional regulator [Anaerolineaceae bacterium]